MKWLGFLLVVFSLNASGQCKTYLINPKGDTINCTDVNGKKQGYWLVRVQPLRGNPGYDEEGYYVDDLKDGQWYKYSRFGDPLAMETYRWGMKDGLSKYYNMNAGVVREESWKAVNPSDPYDTVDVEDANNPGTFSKVRVRLDGRAYKHGTWRYFDEYSGALVKTEKWYMDKIEDPNKKAADTIASTDGKQTASATDSTKTTPKAKPKPKEVSDFEKKNAGKKNVKVRDGRTGG